MHKTLDELKIEKDKLLSELDTYIETDNVQSDEFKEIHKKIACVDDEIKKLNKIKNDNREIKANQVKKCAILICISALILALFVILTIVLNTSTIFKGTYRSENSKIVFYDNTYTYIYSYKTYPSSTFGFYEKSDDEIVLSSNTAFERKNVFKLKSLYGEEFECDGAIYLQIFYCMGMIVCSVFLIVQILKYRKLKNI